MGYSLNNVTTADTYTPENTLSCPECVRVNLDVSNQAILYQLSANQGVYTGGESWLNEVYVPPGWRSLERVTHAIRIKSAVPGLPAQVTVDAVTQYNIDGGLDPNR